MHCEENENEYILDADKVLQRLYWQAFTLQWQESVVMIINLPPITCSKIEVNREFNTIYGSDCTNGTWLHDMGVTNYSTLTIEYAKQRENRERFIKFDASDDESLIPSEPDITILNRTKIKKNMEGCVNTLSLECMHFFAEYGKDGANYTSMVSYDCYYDPDNLEYVVVDFTPERTLKFLIFWAILPR